MSIFGCQAICGKSLRFSVMGVDIDEIYLYRPSPSLFYIGSIV
jgi:hypothetical protein